MLRSYARALKGTTALVAAAVAVPPFPPVKPGPDPVVQKAVASVVAGPHILPKPAPTGWRAVLAAVRSHFPGKA